MLLRRADRDPIPTALSQGLPAGLKGVYRLKNEIPMAILPIKSPTTVKLTDAITRFSYCILLSLDQLCKRLMLSPITLITRSSHLYLDTIRPNLLVLQEQYNHGRSAQSGSLRPRQS